MMANKYREIPLKRGLFYFLDPIYGKIKKGGFIPSLPDSHSAKK